MAVANITTTGNNPSILDNNGDDDLTTAKTPTTYDEAIADIVRLRAIRDALLDEKSKADRFVERYQEKVAKTERLATLRELIPRDLFVRQDRYDSELEHVYNWSGISDDEIADIYRRRINDIK